jgi:hypothetical protein
MGHKGPVRRSTHIDEIPFLAVARSLGDLWSYNSEENVFVVSPEPDIRVYPVDISKHRCLILGTDGAWNMLTPQNAITTVCQAEKANEAHMLNPVEGGRSAWINPSKQLVDTAIERWNASKLRADNTSVVTVMLDPPGPPRAQVLKNRKRELAALNAGRHLPNPNQPPGDRGSMALVTNTTPEDEPATAAATASQAVASSMMPVVVAPSTVGEGGVLPPAVKSACSIISRFPNSHHPVQSSGFDLVKQKQQSFAAAPSSASVRLNDSADQPTVSGSVAASGSFIGRTGRLSDSTLVNRGGPVSSVAVAFAAPARMGRAAPATSSSIQPAKEDSTVQCNEISSSEDTSPRSAERTASASAAVEGEQPVSTSPLSELVSSPLLSSTAVKSTGAHRGKSLSRELSALRLSSAPSTPSRKTSSRLASSSSRSNKRMAAAASSDTENRHANLLPVRNHYLRRGTPSTAADATMPPASSFSDVERRCRDLHATLDSMEQKSLAAAGGRTTTTPVRRPPAVPLSQQQQQTRSVSKTSSASAALVRKNNAAEASSSPHCLRPSADNNSSAVGATPSRSLRSRTAVSVTPAIAVAAASAKSVSGTKRRRPLSVGAGCAAAKSPRTAAGVVVVKEKAAVMNRSRQARVLRLKK